MRMLKTGKPMLQLSLTPLQTVLLETAYKEMVKTDKNITGSAKDVLDLIKTIKNQIKESEE